MLNFDREKFGQQPKQTVGQSVSPSSSERKRLIGYFLYAPNCDSQNNEASLRLEDRCFYAGFKLAGCETEAGKSSNHFRMGLWRALQRLICTKCEPKRMPLSLINFDDFVSQALAPCRCGCGTGLDGLVVARLEHINAMRERTLVLVTELAKMGKHLVAEDGICLSCCHPTMKDVVKKPVATATTAAAATTDTAKKDEKSAPSFQRINWR
jgi:hypothetical protein